MEDPIELLRHRIDALYGQDRQGRIIRTNEWDGRPAPRFHGMFTTYGTLCRFRGDVPDDLVAALEAICRREPHVLPGPEGPTQQSDLLGALEAHAPVRQVWCGPAYRLPAAARPGGGPAVSIAADNAHLLGRCFPDWLADVPHRRPFVAVIEAGHAVSICASVRISPAVHCAGVETHADHRRRGHSLHAVAGWAGAVRSLGATPFYSTSWDNIASQHVARRLGFEMVGVDFHVT